MHPANKKLSDCEQYESSVGVPNKICIFNLGKTTQNTWSKSEQSITSNTAC